MQGRRGSRQDWSQRQRVAPQPDRRGAAGAKPMDFMRRGLPGVNTGAMSGQLRMGAFAKPAPSFNAAAAPPPITGPTPVPKPQPAPVQTPGNWGWGGWQPPAAPNPGNGQGNNGGNQGNQNNGNNGNGGGTEPPPVNEQEGQWFMNKGIPLTGEFLESIRNIQANFRQTMRGLRLSEQEIDNMVNMAKARTMTDMEAAIANEEESLAARGVGGQAGGIAMNVQNDLNTQVQRTFADQALNAQQAYGQLRNAEAEAKRIKRGSIEEVLADAAYAAATSGDRRVSRRRNRG